MKQAPGSQKEEANGRENVQDAGLESHGEVEAPATVESSDNGAEPEIAAC